MIWSRRTWTTLAALGGFVSVAVGAFAAHGVSDPQAKAWLQTGSTYAFLHSLAVLACAALVSAMPRARLAPGFFIPGGIVFAGSLYAMAFGAPRWFGAITPIGGVLFLLGWLVLAWAAQDLDR